MNDTSINCFDGEYSKEQLKELSEQNLLKCPICGKVYEYCHGRVNNPYFRHKDKVDCNIKYQESETPEHIKGKIDLFNWVKGLDGVTDVQLEQYILETDQCADVGFKYGGKQYVIEYQCSPITTEYFERHELYESVGIEDIWICGTDKYMSRGARGKTIEDYCESHYDANRELFIFYRGLKDNRKLRKLCASDIYIDYFKSVDRCFYPNIAIATDSSNVDIEFFEGVRIVHPYQKQEVEKDFKDYKLNLEGLVELQTVVDEYFKTHPELKNVSTHVEEGYVSWFYGKRYEYPDKKRMIINFTCDDVPFTEWEQNNCGCHRRTIWNLDFTSDIKTQKTLDKFTDTMNKFQQQRRTAIENK